MEKKQNNRNNCWKWNVKGE